MTIETVKTQYLEVQAKLHGLDDQLKDHFLPLVTKLLEEGRLSEAERVFREDIPECPTRFVVFRAIREAGGLK